MPDDCLIERDPRLPTRLLGQWPLPSEIPAGGAAALSARSDGLYLVATAEGNNTDAMWKFGSEPGTPPWTPHGITREVVVQADAIQWSRRWPGDEVRPYTISAATRSLQPIEPPWSNGRWAWEEVQTLALLAADRCYLGTPAGSYVIDVGSTNRGALLSQLGSTPIDRCQVIHDQTGIRRALELHGTGDKLPFWIDLRRSSLTIEKKPAAASKAHYATLSLRFSNPSSSPRLIEIQQAWQTERAPAIESQLPDQPDPLVDGQFAWDRAEGAAMLAHPSKKLWLIQGSCPTPDGRVEKWITLNELDHDAEGRLDFRLRGYWQAGPGLRALRGGDDGQVYAAAAAVPPATAWRLLQTELPSDGRRALQWYKVHESELTKAGHEFLSGATVTFDVPTLSWSRESRYLWDATTPPLIVSPSGYQLLQMSPGKCMLACDDFKSLALSDTQQGTPQLHIATAGGLLTMKLEGPPGQALGTAELMLTSAKGRSGIDRVRATEEGLFVRADDGVAMARPAADHAWHPTDWNPAAAALPSTASLPLRSSDPDAWNRRTLTDVVDSYCDDEGNYWVGTRWAGVFRVVPPSARPVVEALPALMTLLTLLAIVCWLYVRRRPLV